MAMPFINKNVSRAKTALENNDTQMAIQYCNEELQRNKRNTETYIIRGNAYNQIGKTDLAIKDYQTALSIDRTNLDIMKKLFFSYAKTMDIQNALVICNQIIALYPSDNDELMYNEICRLLMDRQEYQTCLNFLNEISNRTGAEHHIYDHLKGLNHYYLKDYSQALFFFKKAYQQDESVKYLKSLVDCYTKSNQTSNAYLELKNYWVKNKDSNDISHKDKLLVVDLIAENAVKSIQLENAIQWYEELGAISDTRDEKIEVEHKKAYVYKMMRDYDKALEIYYNIISTNPNSIKEFFATADIYTRKGFYKEALDEYVKIMHFDPYNPTANLSAANLCIMKQDFNSAKKYLDRAYSNSQNNVSYLKRCVEIYTNLITKSSMSDKEREVVYNILFQLIALNPEDVSNYAKVIELYLEEERYESALSFAEKAIIQTKDNKGRLLKAYVEYFMNDESAEMSYLSYVSFQGDIVEGLYYKAKYHFAVGHFEDAKELLEEARSINIYNHLVIELLMQTYSHLKLWDKLIELSDEYILIDQFNYETYYKRAIILARLKQYEDSLDYFKKTIHLNNFYADAFYNMGNVHFKIGDYGEALKCYKFIMHINPNYNTEIYSKIASIYAKGVTENLLD